MEISSRTPEGIPNRCPVCRNEVKVDPSTPTGDAPCPHCGTLLWFVSTDDGSLMFSALAVHVRPSATSASGPQTRSVESARSRRHQIIEPGDRVRITEETFENFEGRVDHIHATTGRVTVMINIYGRVAPVELEFFQVER